MLPLEARLCLILSPYFLPRVEEEDFAMCVYFMTKLITEERLID